MTTAAARIKCGEALPYLPGLAPSSTRLGPSGPEAVAGGAGWWVKTSDQQKADAWGLPCGFKHTLMHGSKAVKSGHGVGADAGRTLREHAAFLNAREQSLMAVTAAQTITLPDMPNQRHDGPTHINKEDTTTDTNNDTHTACRIKATTENSQHQGEGPGEMSPHLRYRAKAHYTI